MSDYIEERIQPVEDCIKKSREILQKINEWVVKVEWEDGEKKLDKLKDEYLQEIEARIERVKTQLETFQAQKKRGDIGPDQFDKKQTELAVDLKKVEIELYGNINPKLKQFIDKMTEFIKKGGITEEKQRILDEMIPILTKFETRGADEVKKGIKIEEEIDSKERSFLERGAQKEYEIKLSQILKEIKEKEPCEKKKKEIQSELDKARYEMKFLRLQFDDLMTRITNLDDETIKNRLLGIERHE